MSTQRIPRSAKELSNSGFLTLLSNAHSQTLEIGSMMVIGRDADSHIVLDDPFISSRHICIELRDSRFLLKDLGSRNGTRLNGTMINEAWLSDGDHIRLGQTELLFTRERESIPMSSGIESKNTKWNEHLKQLPRVANSSLPVLIIGPSGTGKEVLARWLHQKSPRSSSTFVSINCGALTESLVESELFGHLRGSFTGANHDRQGAFQSAKGGTLFLDEIGDLPLSLQPKLLRALENDEIKPVGSDKTIRTDVRVIAATHQNLQKKVIEGEFRQDLYYRLNVICVSPPPLRERLEDFETLLSIFAQKYKVHFSYQAIEKLKQYEWPGNIRELKNVVARASAYFGQDMIPANHLERILEKPLELDPFVNKLPKVKGFEWLKQLEKDMICERLMANGGNQRQTALQLGIPKSTLHDRIKSYNINVKSLLDRPDDDDDDEATA